MNYLVVYYDQSGRPMVKKIDAWSREAAFANVAAEGGTPICEKWELYQRPTLDVPPTEHPPAG